VYAEALLDSLHQIVMYRETHVLLEDLAEAVAEGTRKQFMESVATVPLLIIDDFGMRKLPLTVAEDLLEIIMRRYERTSTLLTSSRPVEDWGKLLGDVAAVPPCSTASCITGMYSSAARGAGGQKRQPLLREVLNESAAIQLSWSKNKSEEGFLSWGRCP